MPTNILWIMTDHQRYDTVGANGNPLIRTPNLDALARESANCGGMYCQSPVCVPSRQTYFSGRYPHSHRNRVNYTPLAATEVLLQRYLSDAGYDTGFVGKLHYYPPTRTHGLATGFNQGLLHDAAQCDAHSDYVKWLAERAPAMAADGRYRDTVGGQDGGNPYRTHLPEELHETTWCGEETRAMLRAMAAGDQPFFLFSSYWKHHPPYEIPEPWASLYNGMEIPMADAVSLEDIHTLPLPVQRMVLRCTDYQTPRETLQWQYRSFYGAVSQIDHQVGLTLRTLEELGLAGNTIVIFCSDHGDLLLEHGLHGKNVFYESAMHVPFMIRYPGVVRPGAYGDLLETTDVLATLFDLCRLETPARSQGRSFARMLSAEGPVYTPHQYVFSENIIPEVITCDGIAMMPYEHGKGVGGILHPDAKMVRDREWKYCYYVGHGHELFHLTEDPEEHHNLADDPACHAIVHRMRQALLDWMITADERDQIAPCWLPIEVVQI